MSLTLDRTLVPDLQMAETVPLREAEKLAIGNFSQAYLVNAGKNDLIKIDLIFKAGRKYESKRLQSLLTARLLREGTSEKSAAEIAELLDFYGASFKIRPGLDHVTISVFSMRKYIREVLNLSVHLINDASFPQNELDIVRDNALQKLEVNLQKTKYLASRAFRLHLFGDGHHYGYADDVAEYNSIQTTDLQSHKAATLFAENASVFISGKIAAETIEIIKDELSKIRSQKDEVHPSKATLKTYQTDRIILPKEGAIQAAIRVGKPIISKRHADYPKLSILNTILGGYFGSRLMSNIREEKGYTYGIYSTLVNLQDAAYFAIGTEVNVDVADDAHAEIMKEIQRLIDEPVSADELNLVRNYLIGGLMQSVDGAFRTSSALQSLYLFDLNTQYFHDFVDTIRQVSSGDLQEMAAKYLSPETLSTIIARNE